MSGTAGGVGRGTLPGGHGADTYSDAFYADIEDGVLRSAQVIVPLVTAVLRPESVLDVGCGTGAWLAEFGRRGASRLSGLDGAWVAEERLHVPAESFRVAELGALGSPLERHDLAVCLEVAEHLPADRSAGLIRYLTTAAPAVLFSAAVPGQGGVGHVNEQWLDHWAERFAQHGFLPCDFIRSQVWENPEVEPWYAQNTVVFADRATYDSRLAGLVGRSLPARVVHPRVFHNALDAWV